MRQVLRALLALLTVVALAAPAAAAPPGNGLEQVEGVTCNGEPAAVTASNGISFWIDDQQYVMTSFDLTFTPDGGDPETFSQTYGQKSGLSGPAITCTATFDDPEGTVSLVVVAVPVPPGR